MATMRQVDTRFWSDNWVRKLNALDRYAFIYLLTNQHSSWCGVYELPLSVMAFESGIDERDLENSILPKLSPKIIYIDGWVYIKNFEKYHENGSDKTKKGIENAWKGVPEEIKAKIKQIIENQIPHTRGIQGVSPFTSSFSFSSSPKGDCELKNSPVYEEIEKEEYNTKAKTYQKLGIDYKPAPKSEKQQRAVEALLLLDYFKDKAREFHGLEYLTHPKDKNGKLQRLSKEFNQRTKTPKEVIDWYLDEYGKWCNYAPENCFTTRTVQAFENKDKGGKRPPKVWDFSKIYEK